MSPKGISIRKWMFGGRMLRFVPRPPMMRTDGLPPLPLATSGPVVAIEILC